MVYRQLIWFRNDLRVHDHEPLMVTERLQSDVMALYCFDPRQFRETCHGFPKTGYFRAKFLLESVQDLRMTLRALGGELVLRWGYPEEIIPALVQQYHLQEVLYHCEVASEEVTVEQRVQQALKDADVKVCGFWGTTLYHPDDLPFDICELPEIFTQFRKRVERESTVNVMHPSPQMMRGILPKDPGDLPTLSDLGLPASQDSPQQSFFLFEGGEQAGLRRLTNYIWEQDCLRRYKETRNGMLNPDDSSKLSPWLSLGCLSPRYVYEQVQKYERERVKNESTYWLIFELLWRDYFRFIVAKHGDRVFRLGGLRNFSFPWKMDWGLFYQWAEGKTGYPLVDANMRELKQTGFMSNRGRQNVASFLTKNLGLNWQLGAEWFESWLIDYDVCSNWGNWNYTAGIGNDARGFRFFNIVKQAKDYDPDGSYVKHWLPVLEAIPAAKVHEPWKLNSEEQKRWTVILGQDYPLPIVDLWNSAAENKQLYQALPSS